MNFAVRLLVLALRLVLACVLIVAGAAKIPDPVAFAAAIERFQVLPEHLVPFAAVALPFFEIILGVLLVTGWRLRCATFSTMVLLGVYTAALGVAMARHLSVECDCFGTAINAPHALLRDVLLLLGAGFLYIQSLTREKA